VSRMQLYRIADGSSWLLSDQNVQGGEGVALISTSGMQGVISYHKLNYFPYGRSTAST
jgi:hypothetical protein